MNGRFRTLYSGFDYFKPRARYFYTVFLIRRAIMIGVILGIHHPIIQISAYSLCQVINMVYLVTTFPYKIVMDKINCMIIESGYLANCALIFFLPTLDDDKDSSSNIKNQGIIMMGIVMGSTNLIMILSLI